MASTLSSLIQAEYSGALNVMGISVDGSQNLNITTTNNGNLVLTPNGTGNIQITSSIVGVIPLFIYAGFYGTNNDLQFVASYDGHNFDFIGTNYQNVIPGFTLNCRDISVLRTANDPHCYPLQVNGLYWISHTTGNFGDCGYIQIASSSDFHNWTMVKRIVPTGLTITASPTITASSGSRTITLSSTSGLTNGLFYTIQGLAGIPDGAGFLYSSGAGTTQTLDYQSNYNTGYTSIVTTNSIVNGVGNLLFIYNIWNGNWYTDGTNYYLLIGINQTSSSGGIGNPGLGYIQVTNVIAWQAGAVPTFGAFTSIGGIGTSGYNGPYGPLLVNGTYYLFYDDSAHNRYATSSSPLTGYTDQGVIASHFNTDAGGNNTESSIMIQVSPNLWRFYLCNQNGGSILYSESTAIAGQTWTPAKYLQTSSPLAGGPLAGCCVALTNYDYIHQALASRVWTMLGNQIIKTYTPWNVLLGGGSNGGSNLISLSGGMTWGTMVGMNGGNPTDHLYFYTGNTFQFWKNSTVTTQSGTWTAGSTTVTLTGTNGSISNGQGISGLGIDPRTSVSGISGTTLTLSIAPTFSGAGLLTFTTASSAGSLSISGGWTAAAYNGLTITTTTGTLTIANGKNLTANNSLTFSGTDGSTLNIGTGGTLGTAAYTASSSYVVPNGTVGITVTETGVAGYTYVGSNTNFDVPAYWSNSSNTTNQKGWKWLVGGSSAGGVIQLYVVNDDGSLGDNPFSINRSGSTTLNINLGGGVNHDFVALQNKNGYGVVVRSGTTSVGGFVGIYGVTNPSYPLDVGGSIRCSNILMGSGSAPSPANGTNATATVTGNNISGTLQVVVAGGSTSGVITTLTLANSAAFPTKAVMTLTSANAAIANLVIADDPYVTGTTNTCVLNSGATGIPAGTYLWNYHISGY